MASTDVLVYDEIDAGIGGVTAVKLAQKLSELSKKHQVIVVTHLPQVALKASKHLSLRRMGDTGQVVELDEKGRMEEIERMLGGKEVIEIIGDLSNAKENKAGSNSQPFSTLAYKLLCYSCSSISFAFLITIG